MFEICTKINSFTLSNKEFVNCLISHMLIILGHTGGICSSSQAERGLWTWVDFKKDVNI